jgi:hypothetical protein
MWTRPLGDLGTNITAFGNYSDSANKAQKHVRRPVRLSRTHGEGGSFILQIAALLIRGPRASAALKTPPAV